MSIHPSLKSSAKSKQHRSVLKRLERLLHLMKKDEWKEGDSIFALAKVKILKFKVKKEKAEKSEEVAALAAAEGAVEGEAAAPGEEGKKPAAPAPGKETGKDKGREKK